jgi:uncharacterized tellurite resistance protein B-like protein
MIGPLLRRLLATAPAPLPAEEARLALAALLVRVARSDGTYSASEIARIDRVLAARHGLTPSGAAAHEDRIGLVESLWSVALADGARDDHEDRVMRLVVNLLGISDRDSALARQRVEGKAL